MNSAEFSVVSTTIISMQWGNGEDGMEVLTLSSGSKTTVCMEQARDNAAPSCLGRSGQRGDCVRALWGSVTSGQCSEGCYNAP